MMGWLHNPKKMKGKRPKMSKEEMGKYAHKSRGHMPVDEHWGDVGMKRQEEAAKVGVTAVIQPGGSVRDPDVIGTADRLGLAMVLTGIRHFRH